MPVNESTHTYTHKHTHTHIHTHTHTHTHTLLYTLTIKDVEQDLEMMPIHSDWFGLAYDSSPFCPVFRYLLPVGHPHQFPSNHVDSSQ